jgi:hypothetical protein
MGIRIKETHNLAVQDGTKVTSNKKVLPYELRAISQTRTDIKQYNNAVNMAKALTPYNYALQLIYNNVMRDAMLTSQIENRIGQIFSMDFNLMKPDGTPDEEQTKTLKSHTLYRFLTRQSLESEYYGVSLAQLNMQKDLNGVLQLVGDSLPRTNIVQQKGLFYPDYLATTKSIAYRDLPEYGTWILEYDSKHLGLLDKGVPHVLFKRFAQSCWSELCEIYGIPPRVMTTNTQDPKMLDRATKMMKDMGAAAWFIIDEDEKFEWAQGVSTNGDVYKNLIELCRDELCLLISGAIIGQNTKNGSKSKDTAAQEMLWLLVQSDMARVTEHWNTINIPALVKHGLLKGELTFEYAPTEDKAQLMEWLDILLQHGEVDIDYIKEKTGIPVTKWKETSTASNTKDKKKLSYKGSNPFFDPAPQD